MVDLKGKVLVVVDMEFDFRANMTAEQVRTVAALIREAVRSESFIVFLVFLSETLPQLLQCAQGYARCVQVKKSQIDGSAEVLDACVGGYYDTSAFVLCGIATHCCVARTAHELAWKKPDSTIEVVMEGCGDGNGNRWDCFPDARNICLVSVAT